MDDKENKNYEEESNDEKNEKDGGNGGNNDEIIRKVLFSLCYIWGILFFIPLVMYKDDSEAKMHANEGLVLLLIAIVVNAVCGIFTGVFGGTVIGVVFGILIGIFNVLILLLGILGIVNVVTENGRSLPFIGSINLIK